MHLYYKVALYTDRLLYYQHVTSRVIPRRVGLVGLHCCRILRQQHTLVSVVSRSCCWVRFRVERIPPSPIITPSSYSTLRLDAMLKRKGLEKKTSVGMDQVFTEFGRGFHSACMRTTVLNLLEELFELRVSCSRQYLKKPGPLWSLSNGEQLRPHPRTRASLLWVVD